MRTMVEADHPKTAQEGIAENVPLVLGCAGIHQPSRGAKTQEKLPKI